MNNYDKKIAIGGVAIIIILAIVAIVLLTDGKHDQRIKVVDSVEKVELKETQETETAVSKEAKPADAQSEPVDAQIVTGVESGYTYEEHYEKKILKAVRNDDSQMAELYGYWDEYKLDAVFDLIRLERVRNISRELRGTDEYYYYGAVNSDNKPEGRGLAIYADDTYYFGDWKNGIREGTGYWLRIYPDKEGVEGTYEGVLEHQYNGQFKNDLPNGEGQEHYTYNVEKVKGETCIVNVLGNFKNGYYDGEVYIMTIDNTGRTYDWYAKAREGDFVVCVENKVSTTGKKPYWKKGDDNDHSTDDSDDGFYWFAGNANKNWGIYCLKK
ncbi:MAG: hypothetical protein K6G69_02030 [Lachnospiraceae bacterium]|nr:hypothetical protein [Lachnospiraceae bacterium]